MVRRDGLVLVCDTCLEGFRALELFEMCGRDRAATLETNAALARALSDPEKSGYKVDGPPPSRSHSPVVPAVPADFSAESTMPLCGGVSLSFAERGMRVIRFGDGATHASRAHVTGFLPRARPWRCLTISTDGATSCFASTEWF